MQKKLFVKSYGCQMNEYDSAKIADLMTVHCNLATTDNPAAADLIVLNTCSIRAKAADKIFSELGRLRKLKRHNPELKFAVGGCVAVHEQKNIFRRAPYVDMVFGPQTLHLLPEMYQKVLNQERHLINTQDLQIAKFDYFPEPKLSGPSAYVSIIEGCNKFCSYCIVPFTRGREVSRPITDILTEVNSLVAQGAREIHLLGQNVNSFKELASLIRQIAQIPEIARIRFTTSHPRDFDDQLIAVFADEPKLAAHLHLPMQSGSDRILKLMRRGYTRSDYEQIITKLRLARPNISLSSDFIVGFPGETAADFAQTLDAVKQINFASAYSFIYSPRPNTLAATYADDVSLEEKKQRLTQLQNQLSLQLRAHNDAMIGTTQNILINAMARKDAKQYSGRTESNIIVNFTASKQQPGDLVPVKITHNLTNTLRGEIVHGD